MAVSYPDVRTAAAAVLLLLAATATGQEVPILLDAATTDFDRRNQRLLFEEVTIERGQLGISANRADTSQLDFADSVWVFRGAVRIYGQDAEVTAERASMEFVDHHIKRATITGAPAVIRHTGAASLRVRATEAVVLFDEDALNQITLTGKPAVFEHVGAEPNTVMTEGSAKRLIYDLAGEKITLAENAWVRQGDNEIRGEEITYDITAQRIVAAGDEPGDRVRITITPPVATETPEPGDDGQ